MYTIKEVAIKLGLHRNTIIKALKTGKIRGVRFGKVWRITEEEIERIKKVGFN